MKNQDLKGTAARIVRLPRDSQLHPNTSVQRLLEETGYLLFARQITEDDIAEALRLNPEYVNDWLAWSEDKRSYPGWFFAKGEGEFHIGRLEETRRIAHVSRFADPVAACAAFVIREIWEMRPDKPE